VRAPRLCESSATSVFFVSLIGYALFIIAGCGSQGVRSTPVIPALQGVVRGGQQPVVGATITLYAAGASGYGSTASSLLTSSVASGTGGGFSITGFYTCPSASTQVYLVATGGNPGLGPGTDNTSLALMAGLGSCGNLTSATHVVINELTTVAAAYALAPFMATNSGAPGASLGTSTTNAQGLTNAFATASNLVDTGRGATPGASLPTGVTVPTVELNTLADILAQCVNSDGSAASGECPYLFTAATPSGGNGPTNTIDAIVDIAQNPVNNVNTLYTSVTGLAPFQPTLGSVPNDWTVAINYSAGGVNGPVSLAVDSSSNLWVVNSAGNSLTEFSNRGVVLSGSSGYTGGGLTSPRFVAVDPSANVWVSNTNNSISKFSSGGAAVSGVLGYTGSGLNSPQTIIVLTGNNIMVADNGANTLSKFTASNGLPYSGSPFTSGGLNDPFGLAVSPANNVWVSNSNNSLSEVVGGSGVGVGTSPYTGGGLNSPLGVAIDHSGNIWVANHGDASLSEFNSSGTPISTSSGYTGGGLVDPAQIAVDGLGHVWVTNPSGNCLSEFSSGGSAISGSSGYTGGGLSSPGGLGIDSSGNVWVPNSSTNEVTEIVGAAAPVVTPLITAVKNSQLGLRP
jgi:streptogramin lyase